MLVQRDEDCSGVNRVKIPLLEYLVIGVFVSPACLSLVRPDRNLRVQNIVLSVTFYIIMPPICLHFYMSHHIISSHSHNGFFSIDVFFTRTFCMRECACVFVCARMCVLRSQNTVNIL